MNVATFQQFVLSALPRVAGPSLTAGASAPFEVLVDAQCPENWDRVVTGFDDVSYDQTAAFSNLSWSEERMSQIMLTQGGAVAAAARIVILTLPGYGKGIAYMRGGPLWRRRGYPIDVSLYLAVLDAIRTEYCTRRGHHLVVTPRFSADFTALEVEMLQSAGFRSMRKSLDPNRYFVNLQIGQQAQLKSLDQGWRRNLKKAQANGFEIALCDSQADLDCFIALNRTMLKRKKFYDSDPVHFLPALTRDLPPSLRPKIVLARYRGKPVVGAAIVFAGDTAHYMFGASDDTMLPLRAGYALQWWLVEWLSREGLNWYYLGGEALSDGLRQFKSGLVGKEGRVVEGNVEWEFEGSRGGRVVAETIFAIRTAKRVYMKLLNR